MMPISFLLPLLTASAIAATAGTGVSSLPDPIVTFTSPGSKTITLKACNSGGCSTTTKTVTVLDPLPKITGMLGPATLGTTQPPALYTATLTGRPPLSTFWTLVSPDGSQQTTTSSTLSLAPLHVGSHTLTLKASNLTAVATASRTVTVAPNYFADVAPDYWAASFINTFYVLAFSAGCGTDPTSGFPRFCPSFLISRADMAVFLGRALHPPPYQPPPAAGIFADVPPSTPYAPWVEVLFRDGITGGCQVSPIRLFCPATNLTRAEMAVLLIAAVHGPLFLPPLPTGVFLDAGVGYWAARWIEQLYRDGITGGCQAPPLPRLFCPANSISRAEIAVFLGAAFHLTQKPTPTLFSARLCTSASCTYPSGLPIAFDVRLTGGIPDAYDWDWNGDGVWDQTTAFPVAHTYTAAGTYTPRMRVRLGSYSALLTHPTPLVITSASGFLAAPTGLSATQTATVPPSAADPPGTPIRVAYNISVTAPSPSIRGYAAFVNSNGLAYDFVTLLPTSGGTLLLPPRLPGAPLRYLSLNAFTTTTRGSGSLGAPLP